MSNEVDVLHKHLVHLKLRINQPKLVRVVTKPNETASNCKQMGARGKRLFERLPKGCAFRDDLILKKENASFKNEDATTLSNKDSSNNLPRTGCYVSYLSHELKSAKFYRAFNNKTRVNKPRVKEPQDYVDDGSSREIPQCEITSEKEQSCQCKRKLANYDNKDDDDNIDATSFLTIDLHAYIYVAKG